MESKKIGTFKEFLKEQSVKKINEARVSLEIEWWDECIVEVMQDLADECNGFLDYETLVKFVKNKFSVLGRPDPGYPEVMLQQHIKDLIYSHHWSSNVFDGMCSWEEDQSQVQALGLAIGELAKVILDKVLETIKTSDDPIPGETRVSLVDKAPAEEFPGENVEDLPFEYESHKVSPVKGFRDYAKMLKESVAIIDMTSKTDCIQYCLDRVKQEVGSFDPDELFNVASRTADPETKAQLVQYYVKNMVFDYLSKQKAKLCWVDARGKKGKDIPEDIMEKGLDQLYQDIADEVLVKIAEINGVSVEDEKTE